MYIFLYINSYLLEKKKIEFISFTFLNISYEFVLKKYIFKEKEGEKNGIV